MERGVHKALLLLMCMSVPAVALFLPSENKTCPDWDYPVDGRICCNKCPPGFKLMEKCHTTGHRSTCIPCPAEQFMDQMNFSPTCRPCKICIKRQHEVERSKCEKHQNTVCDCEDKYFKFYIYYPDTFECRRCRLCGANEIEKQTCTQERNAECVCKEEYYRVKGKCEPCKNCTAECGHLCATPPSLNTRALNPGNQYFINIIGGVLAVSLLLLVLVFVGTYFWTKWSVRKKLVESKSSDDSTLSCKQGLIEEQPLDLHVRAVPIGFMDAHEQPPNLPDFIPPENQVPDLIYTVLDLVPVSRVKQLVRFLGVKDTEIEQAETDYRSCREAHYQMLRMWAERGALGGVKLHSSSWQQLLDGLRQMHLGRAAAELETKYSIQ